MRTLLLCIALLSGCGGGGGGGGGPSSNAPSAQGEHDGATAKRMVDGGAKLVDVRTPQEYSAGHIDGAVNVPVDTIDSADLGPKEGGIVVYCGSGKRAGRAATTLRSKGYTNVYDLGAMSSWPK